MAVSKAAIGATAGTGTAAAAATTALTVGGGTSSEKVSDSLDSVSEPSVNGDDSSIPKATEKVDLEGTPGDVDLSDEEHTDLADELKGPELDELIKKEIDSRSPNKTWSLTNSVFMTNLMPFYCLQKLFEENLVDDEKTELIQDSYKVFENNNGKTFGCLGNRYLRMNKSGNSHWKGISAWEWGIRKGNEGFVFMGSFKNVDNDAKKLIYYSKAYHVTKEGGTWVPKYYKGVKEQSINISDSSKKIPKGSGKLPESTEGYGWGLYNETTINNSCKFYLDSGNNDCNFSFSKSDGVVDTEITKYWFWEEGEGSSKFSDMQSNFDEWWADAFANVELVGVKDKVGTWTAW